MLVPLNWNGLESSLGLDGGLRINGSAVTLNPDGSVEFGYSTSLLRSNGGVMVGGGNVELTPEGGAIFANNSNYQFRIEDSGNFGAFGSVAVPQQPSGMDLSNNVTPGGQNGVIEDFEELSLEAVRNAIYQLANTLAKVNNGLRKYGLLD